MGDENKLYALSYQHKYLNSVSLVLTLPVQTAEIKKKHIYEMN